MPARPRTPSPSHLATLAVTIAITACGFPQRNDVYRLSAPYNFEFYDTHEPAARSFYAAHFAHFGAYELLMDPGPDLDQRMVEFESQVRAFVVDPPKFEPPADIVAPSWTRMAFETGQSMDWTHMLHSQLYDILTDERVRDKQAAGERAMAYYLSEAETAFSTRGYGHRWMEGGGPWAGAFRETYPAVNGILWAYHWHHAAVYEALMESDATSRAAELDRVIRVFADSVLADPPTVMPLTAEVAPRFSRMFPAAAHIFDNLHMMHDVANDVMASPLYTLPEKAAEIARLRDLMSYALQDETSAPAMPMGPGHEMSPASMRMPTLLPSGEWLPQGHPDANMGSMQDMMRELPPGPAPGGDAR
ncbi:MAG: hypothetical protein OEO79_02840 [Gemmatimonadota bacterium]|nr:hypothetical protein [Gemmatimonadota bacterium]MDH3424129.1 hypothetical protein [Gemmatimonadota bacterium]